MVGVQLRSAGLVSAVEISRVGYPSRMLHEELVRSYRALCPKNTGDGRAACESLLAAAELVGDGGDRRLSTDACQLTPVN